MSVILSLLVACTLYLALEQGSVAANEEISLSNERAQAEEKLKKALSGTHESVLKQPLEELSSLETAGKRDIAEILSFEESEKRSKALQSSLKFWKSKMDEVIEPYVRSPELYKDLVLSGTIVPLDPKFNNTAAYKKAEKEIEERVSLAVAELTKRYDDLINERPQDLETVTLSNWKKHGAYWALTAAKDDIKTQGQLSKLDAAKGDIEKAEAMLSRKITSAVAQFEANIQDIYSQ